MPPLNKLQKTGLVLAMSQSFSAQAANIFVDNAGDDGVGCTFREAVISITNAELEPGCRQLREKGAVTNASEKGGGDKCICFANANDNHLSPTPFFSKK